MSYNKADIQRRMESSYENYAKELGGLRAGRASTAMLEPVVVDVYGSKMPLNQVGNISAPEPRLLTVQVWDASSTQKVEKAIRDSGLGLNPQAEGSLIRIPIPELNEERRAELVKVARNYAEQARIAIRNVRRDVIADIKELLKEKEISEDDDRRAQDDIQKITDRYIAEVEKSLAAKEADLMAI